MEGGSTQTMIPTPPESQRGDGKVPAVRSRAASLVLLNFESAAKPELWCCHGGSVTAI